MSAPLSGAQFPDAAANDIAQKRKRGPRTTDGSNGYPQVAFVGYGVGYVGVGGGYGGGAMTTTGVSGGYDAANDAAQAATGDSGPGTAGNGDAAALGDTPST